MNTCGCENKGKKHIIGDPSVANKMIIGGADAGEWKNFSFKDLTLDSALNMASAGLYGNIKMATTGSGDFSDQLKNTFSAGLYYGAKDTGVNKELRSSKNKEKDAWNEKDPKKLFPPPQNATCKSLKELRDKLVLEQASSQYTYTSKVIAYIQEIDDVMNKNNCAQKFLDEESAAQTARSIESANAALAATQAAAGAGNMALGASSGNSMKIGLIVGGLLFATVVTVILVRSKSSN